MTPSIDGAKHEREQWELEEEDRRQAMSRARTVDEYREAAAGILGPGDLPVAHPAGADTSHLITPQELHAEVRAAARRFLDVLAEIDDPLTNMVVADAAWRAALYAAGSAPPAGPGVRELAAEALLGAVAALRPHVPFVPVESGRRAAEALLVCCRSCGKAHRRTTE